MLSNKAILNDTLRIIEDGYYTKDEQLIMLKYSTEKSQESIVILPDEVKQIYNKCFDKGNKYSSDCNSKCFNLDSFSLGIKTKKDYNSNRVLVLNFANPINPGGGVRIGAKAQEEDLCRRSTLLYALESKAASKYYNYNKSRRNLNKSNTIMLHPNVEVFKNEAGILLEKPEQIAVVTCAAPIATSFKDLESKKQYEKIFYLRILSLLICAAFYEYDYLILGAWGCGAFGNDPKTVAELFRKAIYDESINGVKICKNFKRIDFAVLSTHKNNYNFNTFDTTFLSYN